jgi:hypothetical protein
VAGLEIYDDLGIMFADSSVRATDVSDGLSNTLLAVERPPVMMNDLWGWGWWESYDAGDVQIGMKVTAWYQYTSCDSSPQYFGPGAASATVVSFVGDPTFCHAVRFVAYSAGDILPALATIRGGEDVQLPD